MAPSSMDGRDILLVEDDFFVAADFATSLEAAGARVIGPVATVPEALDLISRADSLDGAILDINLRGVMSYEIADVLRARGVPLVFATGYDRHIVPDRYADIPVCEKPIDLAECSALLFR